MLNIKKILLVLLTPLLPILLFALAFDYGVVHTVGNPTNVKRIINESGLYDSLVPSVLKQSGQIDTGYGEIPANDPLVQSAAQKAVPPSEVKKNTEAAIDNIYLWLNGKIDQPNFNINFSGSNADFANSLADNVQQKLSTLPTCTTGYTAGNYDPVNATCLPPGVSAKSAADALRSNLASNSFLSGANFSASDFKGQDTSKTVFQDQLSNAPTQYRRIKATPLILTVLMILVALSLVFLRATLPLGLRHLGITLVATGLFILVFSWLFHIAVADKVVPNINTDNLGLQNSLKNVITDLSNIVNKNYQMFGGLYVLAGIVALSGSVILGRRSNTALEAANTDEIDKPAEPGNKDEKTS